MRLSLWPNLMQPVEDVLALARHAEDTGWDGLWVADHFMGDGGGFGPEESPTLEATAVLAALAAATSRVRLGPLVLGATYRHPAVLANWAATVDRISGGRLVLGLGAGWQENEHRQYGIELGTPGARVARFEEYLTVVRGLLRDERTTFSGEWYSVTDALCSPGPAQDPLPLLVGAKGDRMLGVVARLADEWNAWGLPGPWADRSAVLDRRCEDLGRDPATIRRSTQALLLPTDDPDRAGRFLEAVAPRAAAAGSAAELSEVAAGWADAGVDEVIVPDGPLGTGARRLEALELLATEVFAPFRD
ncbi:MAG: LLM class flavin-dependent oxidoreductase [Microthrixaceae bacterium]